MKGPAPSLKVKEKPQKNHYIRNFNICIAGMRRIWNALGRKPLQLSSCSGISSKEHFYVFKGRIRNENERIRDDSNAPEKSRIEKADTWYHYPYKSSWSQNPSYIPRTVHHVFWWVNIGVEPVQRIGYNCFIMTIGFGCRKATYPNHSLCSIPSRCVRGRG